MGVTLEQIEERKNLDLERLKVVEKEINKTTSEIGKARIERLPTGQLSQKLLSLETEKLELVATISACENEFEKIRQDVKKLERKTAAAQYEVFSKQRKELVKDVLNKLFDLVTEVNQIYTLQDKERELSKAAGDLVNQFPENDLLLPIPGWSNVVSGELQSTIERIVAFNGAENVQKNNLKIS